MYTTGANLFSKLLLASKLTKYFWSETNKMNQYFFQRQLHLIMINFKKKIPVKSSREGRYCKVRGKSLKRLNVEE